jgi:uncharacterized heparinase superfamily protein
MARLTFAEQTRLTKLLVDRSCRAASARLKQTPLLKWRYGPPVADRLLLVPVELRAADPSFANEVEFGHFGLDGTFALLGEHASPFDMLPPNAGWERELHGFGWLRHLQAAGDVAARDLALGLVADWSKRHPAVGTGVAWEPNVVGRRLMSWIGNANLILDGLDQSAYDTTTDLLADQLIHLSAAWRDAPPGQPRLQALTAVLIGHLCIAGHDRNLPNVAQDFAAELQGQILPDGGHISRNPAVLVSLLLDFLPLRQCFITRERPLPAGFDDTVRRMLKMLQYLRLGDGQVARFNGVSARAVDALSTVLGYDDHADGLLAEAPHSKYERLERGTTIVLLDVGSPPPLEVSCQAHAGCLSFEMSARAQAVFVNCGAPSPGADEWQAAGRATSSHNTVCMGGKSSAKLVRDERFEALLGGTPIRFPEGVMHKTSSREGGIEVDAYHDGYFFRFKLLHRRHLGLNAAGTKLSGLDRIAPQRGQLRLAQDLPFSIHFHLDSKVSCAADADPNAVRLTLGDGQIWRFSAKGAALGIEESMNYADLGGPRATLQIVLRGATFGESDVHWCVERVT